MSVLRKIGVRQVLLTPSARSVGPAILRHYAEHKSPADHKPPPLCSAKANKECGDKRTKTPKKGGGFQFHHLVKFPADCCSDACPNAAFKRFDECLYKPSDKRKRKYQVTWAECPPVQIKPKKICCFEKIQQPPVARRQPRTKPTTACGPPPCEDKETMKCPKIHMPRCRPARKTVTCFIGREPTDCTKVDAPYPSFSECSHPPLRNKRKTECECLAIPAQCQIFAEMNKRARGAGGRGECPEKP